MESKTPTKSVSRIQLTPTSKKTLCVICGKIIKGCDRIRLFHRNGKTSNCLLIEKLLCVEISDTYSFAEHVCRGCMRQLATVENKISKMKELFTETQSTLVESHGTVTKKRMLNAGPPDSKRPLFSPSCKEQALQDTGFDEMTRFFESASLVSPPGLCEFTTALTPLNDTCNVDKENFQKMDTQQPLHSVIEKAQSELKTLCLMETNSVLRTRRKDSLVNFSLESVNKEIRKIVPTLTEVIEKSVANPRQTKNKRKTGKSVEVEIISSSAKLLHIYNRDLNLFQNLNSIILLQGGCKKSAFQRLSETGQCMSYQATLELADKLSEEWIKMMRNWQNEVAVDYQLEEKILKQINEADETIDFLSSEYMPTQASIMELESLQQELVKHRKSMHPGYYFVGDNVDMKTDVRQMTKTNQRKDHHMFNMCAYMNRVSGNMLDDTRPKENVKSVHFNRFVPNDNDKTKLLGHFAFLVAHEWCEHLPCLRPFKHSLDKYIPHAYMKETSSKSQRINMGVLMRNEQYNDQMVDICQFYHKHVPIHDENEEHTDIRPVKILSGGDYLTFERHKSAQASMANGNTPSSRLEGLVPKMEEFHNQAELLKVIWNNLYSTQSSKETGTLYAARNALDAKNVTNNPADDFYASVELLNKFSSAYIVCGGIHHFGMTKIEDEPSQNVYTGPIGSEVDMKNHIMKEAKAFLENTIVLDVPQIPLYGIQNNSLLCRFCGKSYKKQKSLRKHEALSHNVDDPLFQDKLSNPVNTSLPESQDFVLQHTRCTLLLCLLHKNHSNAIEMGDGQRIMESNRYLCLLYKLNGCPKYAYGMLETQAQCDVLLSERKAHQLIWNRTVNYQGKPNTNFPNDLDIEHQNKSFKNQIHSYRGTFTERAINRVSRSATTCDRVLKNYDSVMGVFRPSGKHTDLNTSEDIIALVNQIRVRNVYSYLPGRAFCGMKEINANPFHNLDGDVLRTWISSSLKKFSEEHFY